MLKNVRYKRVIQPQSILLVSLELSLKDWVALSFVEFGISFVSLQIVYLSSGSLFMINELSYQFVMLLGNKIGCLSGFQFDEFHAFFVEH